MKNVTSWKEMKPGFYHGHVSYLDFAKYVTTNLSVAQPFGSIWDIAAL